MTKSQLSGVVAAVALAAAVGFDSTDVSAAQSPTLWSIGVHIEYPNGFVYEHLFATGVSTEELATRLEECGRGHAGGSAVRFHCFPVLER